MTVDVKTIRRRNFNGLLMEVANGNQSDLARKLERAQDLINRYLRGKDIGDKFARHVESKLKKERGWMDTDHSVVREPSAVYSKANPHGWATPYGMPISEIGVRVGRKWQELDDPIRDQVFRMIETMLAVQKQPKLSAGEKTKEQKAYSEFVHETEKD